MLLAPFVEEQGYAGWPYILIWVRNATHPTASLSATLGEEPE